MAFYKYGENRIILLIEQLRVFLLSGKTVDEALDYFSERLDDVPFFSNVKTKIGEGKRLDEALQEQANEEGAHEIKKILDALNAGEFAPQKLDELSANLLKERTENFEGVISSANSRIGWLAMFAMLPIGVYFFATLASVFQEAELFSVSVSDSFKIMSMVICSVIFLAIMFSKRLKHG